MRSSSSSGSLTRASPSGAVPACSARARPRPLRVSANSAVGPVPVQVSQPPRRRSSSSSRTLVPAGFHDELAGDRLVGQRRVPVALLAFRAAAAGSRRRPAGVRWLGRPGGGRSRWGAWRRCGQAARARCSRARREQLGGERFAQRLGGDGQLRVGECQASHHASAGESGRGRRSAVARSAAQRGVVRRSAPLEPRSHRSDALGVLQLRHAVACGSGVAGAPRGDGRRRRRPSRTRTRAASSARAQGRAAVACHMPRVAPGSQPSADGCEEWRAGSARGRLCGALGAPLADRHPGRDVGVDVDEVVRAGRVGHHAASSPKRRRSSARSRRKSSPRAV